MKFSLITIISFSTLLCWACNDEEILTEPIPHDRNAHLSIEVRECLDVLCQEYMVIPGAEVYLYKDEETATDGYDHIRIGSTNIEGKVLFGSLEEEYVFVKCTYKGSTIIDQVSIPEQTTSYFTFEFF